MAGGRGRIHERPGPRVDGLPPYLLRFNPSARRVRITISTRRGIVVTLPAGASEQAAVEFLVAKRSWIERMRARIEEREAYRATAADRLPDEVVFPAVGERWAVRYRETAAATVRVRREAATADGPQTGAIVLTGAISDTFGCLRALNRFVDARAREVLPAEVLALADRTGLRPASVAVRHQRSRWGSCSTAGAVSLNRTLVFLTAELARAIMLHELVHLVRHDHSPQFWSELERLDPLARAHRAAMREAWRMVPPWAEAPHSASNGDT